jgi:hypothetical protein
MAGSCQSDLRFGVLCRRFQPESAAEAAAPASPTAAAAAAAENRHGRHGSEEDSIETGSGALSMAVKVRL